MKNKLIAEGKVRKVIDVGNDSLILYTTDRISAFDVVLPNTVPDKGVILTKLSAFWFDFTQDIIPNHMISIDNGDMPAEFQSPEYKGRCMLCKKLTMLPIECIVRGYITGSGWKSYKENRQICGIPITEPLQECEKLPYPLYTPTTKAVEGHDEHITYEQTVELVGSDLAHKMLRASLDLYSKCAEYALERGIIIADTKFEFGIDEEGNLVLADECLTPDSSRFWPANEYKIGQSQNSFDKQFVRDWLENSNWDKTPPAPQLPNDVIELTRAKYIEAFERITEEIFVS